MAISPGAVPEDEEPDDPDQLEELTAEAASSSCPWSSQSLASEEVDEGRDVPARGSV
ncbi:hypothetical protein LTR53_017506, partial [Teratosphaeriaceae sp. CCFEE 6253]